MAKFLILRFSSIGDIVLTTPVLRNLKNQVKDAEIHYCTKQKFSSLISSNPYISKVHALENDLESLIQKLKKENFDYVIDLHNNLRTFIIKKRLGKPSFSFHKLNFRKWLLVNFKINKLPKVHIVDRYLDTVKSFGVKNDGKGLDFFIPPNDIVKPQSLPLSHQQNYIAIAIGAQHGTKRLPENKLTQLCDELQKPIIFLGDDKDADRAERVIAQSKNITIYNACGKYNLNQSASLLQQSKFVITHDTGLMHIASALKKKVISIWGSTVPEFGMYPYQTEFRIIENKNLSCRPCSKIGYEICPKGHFKCMQDLSFEEINIYQ